MKVVMESIKLNFFPLSKKLVSEKMSQTSLKTCHGAELPIALKQVYTLRTNIQN
jgi:hypothetical protein